MTYHEPCKQTEMFLGNSDSTNFPEPHLKDLKTLRMGKIAYDIYGKVIPESYPIPYRPLFIDKSEYRTYNSIMEKHTGQKRPIYGDI